MKLEKTAIYALLATILLILAVPFYRYMALSQIHAALQKHSSDTLGINISVRFPDGKTNEELLTQHPNDFRLRLGLAQYGLNINSNNRSEEIKFTKRIINDLLHDYPTSGIVYAIAIDQDEYSNVHIPYRIESYGLTDEEAKRSSTGMSLKPPTREDIGGMQRCLNLLNKATLADPQNGWFHTLKATLLYGLHRDREALYEIHQAAISPHFTNYLDSRAKTLNYLFDLRGNFEPLNLSAKKAASPSDYFSEITQAIRITTHFASEEIRNGSTDKGVKKVCDITGIGYGMAKNAKTYITALVGIPFMYIGAAAIDSTFSRKARGSKEYYKQLQAHCRLFLLDHKYYQEAASIDKKWCDIDRVRTNVNKSIDTELDDYNTPFRFYTGFLLSVQLIAAIGIIAFIWIVAAVLTRNRAPERFWSKKAGITSALICSLTFAPMITQFIIALPPVRIDLVMDTLINGSVDNPYKITYLILFFAVGLIALLTGFIMMIKNSKAEAKTPVMPNLALIISYISVFGGLVYLTLSVEYFAQSHSIFESLRRGLFSLLPAGPAIIIAIYAAIRAIQFRFGRHKESIFLSFAANARYSSAAAIGTLTITYLFMLLLTAHYGIKTDKIARDCIKKETAVIQRALQH